MTVKTILIDFKLVLTSSIICSSLFNILTIQNYTLQLNTSKKVIGVFMVTDFFHNQDVFCQKYDDLQQFKNKPILNNYVLNVQK